MYVCAKERSGYPAYAEYSENIHNAFGEQGREKAPGIQFRMWLKACMPLSMWMCVCVCDCVSVCVCVHMWASVFVLALYWNTTGWLEFPLQALGVARFEPHICAPALSLLPSLSTPLSFSLWEACILRVLCYFKGRSGYVVHRVYAVQIIYLALSRSLSKQDWVTLKTLYIYVRFYQSFFCILYWPTCLLWLQKSKRPNKLSHSTKVCLACGCFYWICIQSYGVF